MSENKTEQAKQLLVRYIHDKKIKRGSRLPGQDFFRKKFKYGTTTIGAAIRELQKDGVLDVRDKIGAYLLDPEANGHISRTVALTAVLLENSVFYSTLSSFLQVKLMSRGCLMRLFYCENPGVKTIYSIDDFSGLRRCIENGEVQGLIHIDDFKTKSEDYLRAKNIPAIYIGGGNTAVSRCGIFINQVETLRKGAQRLKEMNIKRPAILLQKKLLEHFFNEFKLIMNNIWGFPTEVQFFAGYDSNEGRSIACEISAMPPEKRPDGFIILDDIVGGAFTSELAMRLPADKLPAAVIMRNRQLNIPFSLPRIVYYDVDLMDFSEKAVDLIIKAMKESIMDSGYTTYMPVENDSELKLRSSLWNI